MRLLLVIAFATLLFIVLTSRKRRKPGEPFDWSYRRPWWRRHFRFPPNR
jgi:hypothetical protein